MTSKLPTYPAIALKDIPPASALVFYGGTKITEWFGNHMYHYPYYPAPFHAAFFIEPDGDDGTVLSVGATRHIEHLRSEFLPTRRIDIITYVMDPATRDKLRRMAYFDATPAHVGLQLPDYGWWNFLRAGIKLLVHKVWSGKDPICSQEVALEFLRGPVTVSSRKPEDTYPWDLPVFAEANPLLTKVYTVWQGPEFKS